MSAESVESACRDLCEYVGHEWADAGGGLLMCLICDAEKWADRQPREHELNLMNEREAR